MSLFFPVYQGEQAMAAVYLYVELYLMQMLLYRKQGVLNTPGCYTTTFFI